MVSGDHLETAKKIAVDAGIITKEEAEMDNVCMTGEDFRSKIGGYSIQEDVDGNPYYVFQDNENFKKIHQRVKVIARSIPEDKIIVIKGIQQKQGMIGMAGDSIADQAAL